VNLGKVSNAIHYRDGDGKFTEKVVLTGELNEQDLADFVASMVQSIMSGLEDRFPEGDLLDSSAIFDVASYRGKSAKEIAKYGSRCVGLHKEGASFGVASHVALCEGHVLCAS